MIRPQYNAPSRIGDFVSSVCECGWLYLKLRAFVKERLPGLVPQALRCAVDAELNEYLKLLGALDAQNLPKSAEEEHQLSLHNLLLWVSEPKKKLSVLAMMVEAVGQNIGGKACSILHKFCAHGDKKVKELAEKITVEASKPIYEMIYRFVTDGELYDPLASVSTNSELAEENKKLPSNDKQDSDIIYDDQGEFFIAKAQNGISSFHLLVFAIQMTTDTPFFYFHCLYHILHLS